MCYLFSSNWTIMIDTLCKLILVCITITSPGHNLAAAAPSYFSCLLILPLLSDLDSCILFVVLYVVVFFPPMLMRGAHVTHTPPAESVLLHLMFLASLPLFVQLHLDVPGVCLRSPNLKGKKQKNRK